MIKAEAETGIQRWQSCQHGMTDPMNLERGRPGPSDPNQIDNFLCAEPSLYLDSTGPLLGFPSKKGWVEARVLHGPGKISDIDVQEVLHSHCANCSAHLPKPPDTNQT